MGSALAVVRSGAWLTRGRIRLWAWAVLAASGAALIYLIATADGLNDAFGRPLGTDFSNIYVAGTYALEGRPSAPFDLALQYARAQAIFGDATQLYGWHYPPIFLFVAAALARLPYVPALIVWQAATFALYLGAIAVILKGGWQSAPGQAGHGGAEDDLTGDRLWLLIAAAFPAVFVNIGHGHNGFLTAALLGSALALLDRRPTLAGVLIGLLAYKPQFGVLIPLVLIASGRWRCFGAAAATVAVLGLLVTLVFGWDVWGAFAESMTFTRKIVLDARETGWAMIQSLFSAVRMWGGSLTLAYGAQAVLAAAVAISVVRLWRSEAAFALKAAGLAVAVLLATPYVLDYDLMVLAPGLAFLVRDGAERGFAPYERSVIAAAWLVPLVGRAVTGVTVIPLGLMTMLALMAVILLKAGVRSVDRTVNLDASADRSAPPALPAE